MEHLIQQLLLKLLTGERESLLAKRIPSRGELDVKFQSIDALGIYLHIPFCEQICPYCPYNKELYRRDVAERYANAAKVTPADLAGYNLSGNALFTPHSGDRLPDQR